MKNLSGLLAVLAIFLCASSSYSQNNLLVPDIWPAGTGNTSGYIKYGISTENERIPGNDPFGASAILWTSKPDGSGGPDGGFYSPVLDIDPNKTYRFTVWLKKTGSDSGKSYFGLYSRNSSNTTVTQGLNGTVNTNPYFWSGDLPQLDRWYLLEGYVHPNSYSGSSIGTMYDGVTKQEVTGVNFSDYKFGTGGVKILARSLLFGDTSSSNFQYYWKPTIYEVNSSMPSIDDLLGVNAGVPVTGVSLNAPSLSLEVNTTGPLSATISPNNATNQAISWSSSDTSIATVSSLGSVTGIAVGTATITVTTSDGGFTATSAISVTDSNNPPSTGDYWTKTGSNINYVSGNVSVGTTTVPSGYKMAVDGKLISEEVKVQLSGDWPDYVFFNDYNLPTLQEVRKYIEEKGHLINIPLAEEVEANGIELGQMNKLLLEKIEELTLYTLQQETKLQELEVLRHIQKKKNTALENRLTKLEASLNN